MPLWNIETHDTGLEPHCKLCGKPFSEEPTEIDGFVYCPACVEICRNVAQIIFDEDPLMRIRSLEADLEDRDNLDLLEFDDTEP